MCTFFKFFSIRSIRLSTVVLVWYCHAISWYRHNLLVNLAVIRALSINKLSFPLPLLSPKQSLPGVHYSIGKALSFYSHLDDDGADGESSPPTAVQGAGESLDWYECGAAGGCPFSALEIWKIKYKPHVS